MPRSTVNWLRLLLLAAAVAIAVYLLHGLGHIVRLLIIGGLLAYLLDPLVRAIEARGHSRRLATGIVCIGLALVLAGLIYTLFPVVATQVSGLQQGFNASDVKRLLDDVDRVANSILRRLGAAEVDVPMAVYEWFSRQSRNVLTLVPGVVSVLTDIVLVPFVMFFLLRDGPDMKRTFISWLPNRYFEFGLTVIHKSSLKLSSYLRGQATAALLVGVLASTALHVLEVDYFLIVGSLAGLANMIPYLGPVAGGVVAVSVSALTTGSLETAPWIVIAFVVIQMIDNTLVQPLVLSRNVEMHPLAVILVLIVGGQFFGLWGLLLAVPVAGVAKVVVSEVAGSLRGFHLA